MDRNAGGVVRQNSVRKRTETAVNPSERDELLGQCAYLIDELEALEPLLRTQVPADVLVARPLGKWSILETLGHLVDCEAEIFRPRLERMVAESNPEFENVDQDALVVANRWQECRVEDLLERLRLERRRTLDLVGGLTAEAWERAGRFPDGEVRDVSGVLLYMVRHDAHHLRGLGYRLHESHLTSRPVDLPK